MIILDTNVLSSLMLLRPDKPVVDWLDAQPRSSVWTTAVTIFEIRFGLQIMPASKRRTSMMAAVERILLSTIDGRVAPFDSAAAEHTADIMTTRKRHGTLGDLRDAMIGGIALSTRAQLATRNTKHFDDLRIQLINPWVA